MTYLAAVIDILGVSAGSDSGICRNTVVNPVDRAECIDVGLVVSKSPF